MCNPKLGICVALVLMMSAWSVWAETDASARLNATLGSLSADASAGGMHRNISLIQNQIDALHAQTQSHQATLARTAQPEDTYTVLTQAIAQQEATAHALDMLKARIQDGYVMTGYDTSTDVATLVTTVTMTLRKTTTDTNGHTSVSTITLKAYIPPVTHPDGTATANFSDGNRSGNASNASGNTDMLTQMLQNLAMQMAMQQAASGGSNPLGAVQPALNAFVAGTPASPVPPPNPDMAKEQEKAQACTPDGAKPQGPGTATYDIAAGKVYMPNGDVLEAHSGMGYMMDNPNYINQRMSGPTPPNVYNLSMREGLFYGYEAVRLTPTDPSQMYGRDGILAHPKLVRGNNGSHGCVAFADYAKFLAAFKRGEVKKMVVVKRKADCRPVKYNQSPADAPADTPTDAPTEKPADTTA